MRNWTYELLVPAAGRWFPQRHRRPSPAPTANSRRSSSALEEHPAAPGTGGTTMGCGERVVPPERPHRRISVKSGGVGVFGLGILGNFRFFRFFVRMSRSLAAVRDRLAGGATQISSVCTSFGCGPRSMGESTVGNTCRSKISSTPSTNWNAATCWPCARSATPTPHLSSSRRSAIGTPPNTEVSRIRDSPTKAYGPANASPRV